MNFFFFPSLPFFYLPYYLELWMIISMHGNCKKHFLTFHLSDVMDEDNQGVKDRLWNTYTASNVLVKYILRFSESQGDLNRPVFYCDGDVMVLCEANERVRKKDGGPCIALPYRERKTSNEFPRRLTVTETCIQPYMNLFLFSLLSFSQFPSHINTTRY